MARPKTPDGHRHHVNIKLSDAEAAVIDAARGDLERGPWMRKAALSVARRDSGIPQQGRDNRAPEPPSSPPRKCRHPNLRIAKGVCPDCSTYVASRP